MPTLNRKPEESRRQVLNYFLSIDPGHRKKVGLYIIAATVLFKAPHLHAARDYESASKGAHLLVIN